MLDSFYMFLLLFQTMWENDQSANLYPGTVVESFPAFPFPINLFSVWWGFGNITYCILFWYFIFPSSIGSFIVVSISVYYYFLSYYPLFGDMSFIHISQIYIFRGIKPDRRLHFVSNISKWNYMIMVILALYQHESDVWIAYRQRLLWNNFIVGRKSLTYCKTSRVPHNAI